MNDQCIFKCNSLIYKCIYSEELKNKDTILKIASYCKQFSLQHFFITARDLVSTLANPTKQVKEALNDIFIETKYTKEIQTLNIRDKE